jgi:hypothetical protein
MANTRRFPFTLTPNEGNMAWMPRLKISLNYASRMQTVSALLDTGSTVNVLPFHIGIELGADWGFDSPPLRLTGNLANFEAKPLIVTTTIDGFDPIPLVFAWTRAEGAPLILGHMNFFLEFNVCLFRSEKYFELTR